MLSSNVKQYCIMTQVKDGQVGGTGRLGGRLGWLVGPRFIASGIPRAGTVALGNGLSSMPVEDCCV